MQPDVWSLCVVLYEMVSGEHPFAGGKVEDVADRIRRQRLGRRARSASDTQMQSAVVAFAATVLATARSARPATARAFADALGGVLDKGIEPSSRYSPAAFLLFGRLSR